MEKTDINEVTQLNKDYTLFHWIAQAQANPINVTKSEGVYFWDDKGKRYIDFVSQLVNVNIGHNVEELQKAILQQMKVISHCHPTTTITDVRGKLGKKISEIAPKNLNKTFFTLCGSTSNEAALSFARLYSSKHKILSQYRSYHGTSSGALSVSGDPRKEALDKNLISGTIHFEGPYSYRCPWGQNNTEDTCKQALNHLERVIQFEGADSIAAVFLEGESGTSGCIKYPDGYLKGVRDITKKYGILLIIDEVMSGFGRCGDWFASNRAKIEPDMITMAKGLTSGYIPLGGVIVSDEIAKFFDNSSLVYGMTFGAHPVACAAALANIEYIQENNLIDNVKNMEIYLKDRLDELSRKHKSIGDVRLTGLLGVIELVKNRENKEPMAPWNAKPSEMDIMNKVNAKLKEQGFFGFPRWNFIFIAPPLVINKQQIDEGLEMISKALEIADEYCY